MMSVLFKILVAVFLLNIAWLCLAVLKAHQRERAAGGE